jgi:hypothetical protein
MNSKQMSINKNRTNSLVTAALIWFFSILFAFIALWMVVALPKSDIFNYPSSSFGLFTGSILAFIGVVLAVLFGVFTTINSHSRSVRNTGFQRLRQATSNLENLNIRLKTQILTEIHELDNKAPFLLLPNQQELVQEITPTETLILTNAWIQDIDSLTKRLNLITMNWLGWDSNPGFETELNDHVHFSKVISENIENEIQPILTEYEQNMRDVLFGLRLLDEAAVGDILVLRLGTILGSLSTLIAAGMAFRLAADLDIGLTYLPQFSFVLAAFLAICIFLHLLLLVYFVSRWWDNIRKRDSFWES